MAQIVLTHVTDKFFLHSGVDGVTSLAGNTPLVESRPDALGMGLTRNELKKKKEVGHQSKANL